MSRVVPYVFTNVFSFALRYLPYLVRAFPVKSLLRPPPLLFLRDFLLVERRFERDLLLMDRRLERVLLFVERRLERRLERVLLLVERRLERVLLLVDRRLERVLLLVDRRLERRLRREFRVAILRGVCYQMEERLKFTEGSLS